MPEITFLLKDGSTETVEASENWSVMQIAKDRGFEGIEGVCGGSMACATCHCYIHPDWVKRVEAEDNEQSEEEKDILDGAFDIRETSRLGCQVKITNALDGLVVAMPGTETGW
ncbi:MAG: 2Fe-2S iron-sulfur cluster-binding protein [Alphaproteobacteria bacterium]